MITVELPQINSAANITLMSESILWLTKRAAAKSQLETAITLWFQAGDPISIFTLSTAANDCYNALSTHAGTPSVFQSWLRLQSASLKDLVRTAQNFAKHGKKCMTGKVPYPPVVATQLIMDSIVCQYVISASEVSPLMRLFLLRYVAEDSSATIPPVLEGIVDRDLADQLGKVDRLQFFQDFSDAEE